MPAASVGVEGASGAASPSELARLGPKEVERLNTDAWRNALIAFRARNPDVLLIAYNGYGGETSDTYMGERRETPPTATPPTS